MPNNAVELGWTLFLALAQLSQLLVTIHHTWKSVAFCFAVFPKQNFLEKI